MANARKPPRSTVLQAQALMPVEQGTHRYPPMERVIYGIPLAEALAQEVERIAPTRSMSSPAAPWSGRLM